MLRKNAMPIFLIVIITAATIIVRHGRHDDTAASADHTAPAAPFTIEEARPLFPEITRADLYAENIYIATDAAGVILGFLLPGPPPEEDKIFGYAGKVPFLIGFNRSLHITGVTMLPNRETGGYVEAVDAQLSNAWTGLSLAEASKTHVDAVTGATRTSSALIEGVMKSASSMTDTPGIPDADKAFPESGSGLRLTSVQICTSLFLATTIWLTFLPGHRAHKSNTARAAASVIIPGFMAASLLSLPTMASLMRGDILWQQDWLMTMIAVVALAIPVLFGRNVYCHRFCPFGSAQDIVAIVCPGKKWHPGAKSAFILRSIRTALALTALFAIIFDVGLDLAIIEPFAAFRWRHAPPQITILAISLLGLSAWSPRLWCRICPSGFVIEGLRRKRTGTKQVQNSRYGKKNTPH